MVNFAVRGGASLKKKWTAVQKQKTAKHQCPQCQKIMVRRISFATWKCKSCGIVFAGGANSPTTLVGKSLRMILQKGVAAQKEQA